MFKLCKSASLATVLVALGAVSAGAVTIVVDSAANSTGGGSGAATGIFLTAGQSFTVTAGPLDTWSSGLNEPGQNREGNADGLVDFIPYNQGGLSALYGTLVGQIGSGSFITGNFFSLGLNFSGIASATGQLFLYNFDSNQSDNSGSIAANVSTVPLPPGLVLAGSALLLLGAMGARRKNSAV